MNYSPSAELSATREIFEAVVGDTEFGKILLIMPKIRIYLWDPHPNCVKSFIDQMIIIHDGREYVIFLRQKGILRTIVITTLAIGNPYKV